MSISLLRQLLMKEAVKKSAGSSGIMTINKNIVKDVDQLLQKYINDALAQGVDLDTLSPEQLKMIVAMNRPKPPKVYSGQEAMDQLNKLFPKTGEVFDLQGNKLNPNKPIMGGTQGIETLLKKGDVTKGTVSKKSDKVLEREMFEEANKKFNKASKEDETQFFKDVDEAGGMEAFLDKNPIGGPTKKIKPKMSNEEFVADSVARITSMEPVAAMKEANKIIKREGIYKNLDETQSKKILTDTEDWIFQRDPADRYDYKKNRPFRDDPNFDPDDPSYDPDDGLDYATGGRAGFANGSDSERLKQINEALKNKMINDAIKQAPGGVLIDPPPRPNYDLIEEMTTPKDTRMPNNIIEFDDGTVFFKDSGEYYKQDGTQVEGPSKGAKIKPKILEAATGGRAGYYTGGMVDVEPNLSDIGHGSDALMARTRLVSPNSQATTSTGLNYLLAEDNDNIRVPFKNGFKVYPKIMASKRNINLGDGKNVDLQDLTYGGTLMYDKGPFSAGIEYLKGKDKFDFKDKDLTLDKDTTDRELANLILMMKLKDGSIKFKGNKDDQMINFSKSFADGGRIGFAAGGDPKRRAFLKLIAALTGGIAGIKSGILGLGEGTAKKAVSETVKKAAGSSEVPPYFFKLVDKIKTMGDETLASQDKAIAKKYKDYVMEEDFAGNITIIKKNPKYQEDVYMSYKVDEVPVKGKKGSTKVEEYEETTVRPDQDGKMKDSEPGVPDEVVNEGSVFEDNITEFGITKKADGGRIGFSAGKNLAAYLADRTIKGSSTRFLEKVFGKQGLKEIVENDPDMHKGLLEVVEMFRAKDSQGLKTYMQKFLPHMDDEMIEDFIIGGTEATEGIAGQLTRLGSARDYKGKLEMMKKADNIEKLDNLDVTEEIIRKPNASGGIATMLGE